MNTGINFPIKFKDALSTPELVLHLVINQNVSIDVIKKFVNLKALSVEGKVSLATIFDFINHCELTFLALEGGNIDQLDFTKVISKSLKELRINESPLKTIHGINNFENLEYLNLSNCNLSTFDIDLRNVPITYLDLSYNALTYFNEGLLNPLTIQTIILHNNKIEKIGYADSLPFLHTIYLFQNKLRYYTPKENAYPSIVGLFISINELESFPEIEMFSNLKKLSVSNNENIKVIPQSLFDNLSQLEYLEVSNIGIELLPQNIVSLQHLTHLDISNNGFDSFPEVVLQLQSLKNLIVSSNDLYKIPSKISSLKNLEYFDCSFCELEMLPDELFDIKSLRSVYMELNNFKADVSSYLEKKMNEAGIRQKREV